VPYGAGVQQLTYPKRKIGAMVWMERDEAASRAHKTLARAREMKYFYEKFLLVFGAEE